MYEILLNLYRQANVLCSPRAQSLAQLRREEGELFSFCCGFESVYLISKQFVEVVYRTSGLQQVTLAAKEWMYHDASFHAPAPPANPLRPAEKVKTRLCALQVELYSWLFHADSQRRVWSVNTLNTNPDLGYLFCEPLLPSTHLIPFPLPLVAKGIPILYSIAVRIFSLALKISVHHFPTTLYICGFFAVCVTQAWPLCCRWFKDPKSTAGPARGFSSSMQPT